MFDERRANDMLIDLRYDKSASALERASDELKNDKDFMLKAVSVNGRALEYASPELQNDKDVALAAVSQKRNDVAGSK